MNRFNKLFPILNYVVSTIPARINQNFVNYIKVNNPFASNANTPIFLTIRHISVTPKMFNKDIVSFDEFKTLTKDKSTLIIDVREPQELQDTGIISGSINIPCN